MKNVAGRSPNSYITKGTILFSIPTKDDTFQSWANKNGGIYYTDQRANGYSSKLWRSPFLIDIISLDLLIKVIYAEKYYSFGDARLHEKEIQKLWKSVMQAKASKIQSFFDEHCGVGRIEVSKRTEETRILIPVSPSRFKMLDVK